MNIFKSNNENKRVDLVIKSWENYNNHDINIFRDCLECWSKFENQHFNHSFKFRVIEVEPKENKKLFFVSTTVNDLRRFRLDGSTIQNTELMPGNFMDSSITQDIFSCMNQFA